MTSPRRSAAALVAVLTLPLAACANQTTSAASCASPQATVVPAAARPGQAVHLRGGAFIDGCDDVVANGVHLNTQAPLTGLTVRLEQGTSSWTLARDVDAATRDGVLDLTVTVPADVHPGPATLQVTGPGLPVAPSAALSVQGGG